MEDNIPPSEEYISISGFNVPASHKRYLENEAFIKELTNKYPQGRDLNEKMIEDAYGTFGFKIAMKDPEFASSLERAIKDVEEGKTEVLEDDFFD